MSQWIVRDFDRPPADLVRQLAEIPTGILSDCMNRFYAMDAGIRPLVQGMRLLGPALTVQSPRRPIQQAVSWHGSGARVSSL